MNIHLIAGESDSNLLDSPLLQGLNPRVARLDFPGLWLLLDLRLEWEPGLALMEQLRRSRPQLGILVSGAGRDVQACVQGYQHGADFFMNQPVMHEELMAAVHAQVRLQARMQAMVQPEYPGRPASHIAVDGLRLQMRGPKGKVSITTSEFKLLHAFVRTAGQMLKLGEIQRLLDYGPEWHERPGRLSVLIYRLRRKLVEAGADAKSIRSLRSLGYELVCPVSLMDPLDFWRHSSQASDSVLPLSFERRIVETGQFEETSVRP